MPTLAASRSQNQVLSLKTQVVALVLPGGLAVYTQVSSKADRVVLTPAFTGWAAGI
jgi:hypothetical protein